MKLSFIALVFLLYTVTGNRSRPAKKSGHGVQNSNKHKLAHSSSGTRRLHLNSGYVEQTHQQKNTATSTLKLPTGKSGNTDRGKDGKIQQQQKDLPARTPAPTLKPSTRKSGNPNSGKDGKTQQQPKDAAAHTPAPQLNPHTGKSGNPNSGKDGKTQQEPKAAAARTPAPKLNPPTGKSGNPNSGKDGKTQHQPKDAAAQTPAPKLNPPTGKSGNSNSGKDGKTQQQQQTQDAAARTPAPKLNPPTGKSANANSGKYGKTQQQQQPKAAAAHTPAPKVNSSNRTSGNPHSTEDRSPQQQKILSQHTSTMKPPSPSTEKSSYFNSGKDGQQNTVQNTLTSTFKPPTTETSGNSSRSKVRETPLLRNNFSSRVGVHHHYHYTPPQQINYRSSFYPVYQGQPPVYVYQYRDSGSRFDNLLTGLALYNLGRNSHSHHYSSDRQYSGTPGEVCKLRISKQNGEFEETRINCNLMSSFIWEDTRSTTQNQQHVMRNTTQVTVTQTVNGTGNSSATTVTVTSNTVEDALKVKGPSIAVTPGMACYMIRTYRGQTALRRNVDCALLQEYARSSLFRNSAQCLMPLTTVIFNFLIIFVISAKL